MSHQSMFDRQGSVLMLNSLGVQQVTQTLLGIAPNITEQKFYTLPFAQYLPVITGQNAFMTEIGHWRTFSKMGSFEEKVAQNMANHARPERVDATYDMVKQPTLLWTAGVDYSVVELEQTMRAGALVSIMEARYRAAKKEWDLGVQRAAFLGSAGQTGLLNNASVTNNTSDLTKRLGVMTAAELNTFVGVMYEKYRSNCARTAEPACHIMPEADWNGLGNFPDSTYPLKTRYQILKEAWEGYTGNPNFKILKCAYGDKANFDGTNNRHCLHSMDPDSLNMNIPVPFTMTASGTTNGFTYESVCYGQYTGVVMLRPAEVLYFSNTAT